MEKVITKTSRQVELEREKERTNNSCPECGSHCLGTYTTRSTGFFSVKTEKKYNYRCINCGCEWTNGWV